MCIQFFLCDGNGACRKNNIFFVYAVTRGTKLLIHTMENYTLKFQHQEWIEWNMLLGLMFDYFSALENFKPIGYCLLYFIGRFWYDIWNMNPTERDQNRNRFNDKMTMNDEHIIFTFWHRVKRLAFYTWIIIYSGTLKKKERNEMKLVSQAHREWR